MTTILLLVAMLWMAADALASGQVFSSSAAEKPQERTVGPFNGTVVDAASKPVPGATVWVVRGKELEDAYVASQATADEQGRFQIPQMKWETSAEGNPFAALIARDSQRRIGGQIRYLAAETGASTPELRIKLEEVKEYRGRLTDATGQPIAKAIVRPTSSTGMRGDAGYYQNIVFPAEWERELAAETVADGTFTFRDLPSNGVLFLAIHAEGFGKLQARLTLEKSATLQLARPGRLRGSVTCEKNPEAVAGIKIRIHASSAQRGRGRQAEPEAQVFYSESSVTQKDGTFEFENVQPGTCNVQPQLPDALPYYADGPGPVEVKSGEAATVSLALKPAAKVQGKVVDGQTGAGVPGVRVSIYHQDQRGPGGRHNPATTDEKGAFVLYARPGTAQLHAWPTSDQYARSSHRQPQIVEVKEDVVLEPIRLEKATAVEGIVVDKAGNPVADAEIRYSALDRSAAIPFDRGNRCDAAGKFTLKQMPPKQKFSIRARTKKAAAEPVNVTIGETDGPIRLVVDEKTSFGLRGTVVDEAGQPVPEANVALTVHLFFGDWGLGFQGESYKTGADGKFEFGGLWAGDKYDVQISAKGCDKYGSRNVEGTAGGVHDFGKITMLGTGAAVEGAVVDSLGKPVADAHVFNSGDGAEFIETHADNVGKFRLQGFHRGPVYVFAEKEGYRFAGLKTTAGVADAVVTLRRTDEPPRHAVAVEVAASVKEQEQESARRLLKILATSSERYVKEQAGKKLADLDAKEVAKADKRQEAKATGQARGNDINQAAEEDVEEALSLLPQDQNKAYRALRDLAKRFADSDPQKAFRFAAEAILRARSLDDPDRTLGLAELGALVARLGNKEVGDKLVREVADMAAKWPSTDQREWQIASLAKTIAPLDLPRALVLSEKIKKERRGTCVANMAVGLDDLEKAESLLKDVEPWYAGRARARLAYRIAATRPADAIRLVDGIPTDNGREESTKAAAFGWLAPVIAPQDPALGYSLIDRALAIYLRPADRSAYGWSGRTGQAAMLAFHAKSAGYPDMESVIYRVLATRPSTKDAWSPVAVQESAVVMATFLALVDRPLAKQTLQAIEANSAALGAGYSGVESRDWLRAWALVDPPHAAELFERELAAAKDENAKRLMWYTGQEMVEFWTSNPNNVVKLLARGNGSIFSPDQEY